EPSILTRVDPARLVQDVGRFFRLDRADVEAKFRTYRAFHEAKGYARTQGEFKTLCFEEAFVLYTLLATVRPRRLAQIGSEQGTAPGCLLAISPLPGLNSHLFCFDETARRRHIHPGEAEFVPGALTGQFRQAVLESHRPEVIYHDRHAYAL